METNIIRVLIVDDEPPARRRIRKFLAAHDDIEIVGESTGGAQAVTDIESHGPDLVFLDIQMPRVDGFEVIERVGPECMPVVIFVTAYEQHALRAFEIAALDYLLKPFDAERFALTLDRARDRLARRQGETESFEHKLVEALAQARSSERHPVRLAVKVQQRVVLLAVADIEWIEAAGKYVRLHTRTESYLHRERIGAMQEALDPGAFARIHRSTIVNLGAVVELEPTFHGNCTVLLRDGTRLTLSRRYRSQLRGAFGDAI
jgi:two-component system LytT family response regulator